MRFCPQVITGALRALVEGLACTKRDALLTFMPRLGMSLFAWADADQ
jgi:hypothetical protein